MKKKLSQCGNALAAAGVWLQVQAAWAAPTAEAVLGDVRGFLADAVELLTWVLLVAAYLVAAYLILDGGIKLFKDRDGGLQRFIMGLFVAAIMMILTTFFVTTGQGEIGNIRA